jgi:hydrogenase maturation protease
MRVLVLGIGNPLVEDEGVGVRVAEALMEEWTYPEDVAVVDAGTMGMSMLGLLSEAEHVVVIDAVDGTGATPGSVVRMTPEEIATSQVLHSLHDMKLADVLAAAAMTGVEPHVEFVGIQVGSMRELVTDLTVEVEAAIPEATAEVLRILDDLGVGVTPRSGDHEGARVIRAWLQSGPRCWQEARAPFWPENACRASRWSQSTLTGVGP